MSVSPPSNFYFFLISFLSFSSVLQVGGSLSKKLRRYELTVVGGRQVVKRSLPDTDQSSYNHIQSLTINALDQEFRLYLTPQSGLLHAQFKAEVHDEANDQIKPIHVQPDQFFHGHVFGYKDSKVRLTFDGEALLGMAQIDNDTIFFEPAYRHEPTEDRDLTLVYLASDVLQASADPPSCGYIQLDDNLTISEPHSHSFSSFWSQQHGSNLPPPPPTRTKRQSTQSTSLNRCPLKLVADYKFYKHIGQSNDAVAIKYIINLIDRVNAIYTSTDFGGLTNMGFMLKEVVLKSSASPVPGHYNSDTAQIWQVDHLLRVFTEYEGSSAYCLVHLLTSQSFAGGVLGLGYIAGPRIGSVGGICSAASYANVRGQKVKLYYNTALSTMKSTVGDNVITREADIVTAHELGHNWGSPHDPQSEECSPPSRDGGSYIMHTFSVSGYDPHNKLFSPCSIRNMRASLNAKLSLCFQPEQASFCGNQRVEENEQCDTGLTSDTHSADTCCAADCTLQPFKQCSPKNSICCTDQCQFALSGTACTSPEQTVCHRPSQCTGLSGVCPQPRPDIDGKPCFDGGQCQNGTCIPFCETLSIPSKPCLCEKGTHACYRCCRALADRSGACKPVAVTDQYLLPAGTQCINGYCDQKHVCKQNSADIVSHLWNIIDRYDRSGFWRFMEDNLVLAVVVATLLVWIPGSVIVAQIDKRTLESRTRPEMAPAKVSHSSRGTKSTVVTQPAVVDNRVPHVQHL